LIAVGAWLLLRALFGSEPRRQPFRPAGPRHRPWTDQRWAWPDRPTATQVPVSRPIRTVPSTQSTVRPAQPPARPSAPPPRRELPIDVQVKVEQIRRKADMLNGYADRFPPFSHDLHIVRQTAADYLPRTVEAYLKLTGDGDPAVGAGGKTALDELKEQLNLLDSKLDEIAQDLQRQDVDQMLANRRFLEERFKLRDRPSEGDLPPAGETSAA
jgi:hypothetical protein